MTMTILSTLKNTFQTVKRTFSIAMIRQIVHSLVPFCGQICISDIPMLIPFGTTFALMAGSLHDRIMRTTS